MDFATSRPSTEYAAHPLNNTLAMTEENIHNHWKTSTSPDTENEFPHSWKTLEIRGKALCFGVAMAKIMATISALSDSDAQAARTQKLRRLIENTCTFEQHAEKTR